MVGGFHSIDASLPNNAGSFRRIDLALRENCVVGIIRHPTSTSVATSNVADRVANPVQCAIAEIAAGQCLAECSAVIPPTVAVIAGIHPKTGGAAAPNADAWLTIGHVGNAGMCNLDSVELDKMRQPIHVHSCRLLPDTKGAGQHIGAPSIEVAFGPVGCDISVGYVSDGMVNPARGVRGRGRGRGRCRGRGRACPEPFALTTNIWTATHQKMLRTPESPLSRKGRRIFEGLTVAENLLLGQTVSRLDRAAAARKMAMILAMILVEQNPARVGQLADRMIVLANIICRMQGKTADLLRDPVFGDG